MYPVWHPYTPALNDSPILITRGKGTKLFDEKGNSYIDAVSSWWTNIHGHAHPHIAKAIAKQSETLEQVIFAGFTHPTAIELADLLLKKIPYHHKVFYSDNGSTAVEAAIKMALQFWSNKGKPRTKIICFRDAYHGDTFGSMSISARGVFTQPYNRLLFDVVFIDTPTKGHEEKCAEQLSLALKHHPDDIAAFIFEPLVLGSAGMLMYSADVLDKLVSVCKDNGIITIADEVMTGFGRTGKFLATDFCRNKPDIICLSKGITGGFMPFAATTCSSEIFEAFNLSARSKMLFHGHSYTGNPLGCAAAVASLQLFELENTFSQIRQIEEQHTAFAKRISGAKTIKEARQLGTILAIELDDAGSGGYLSNLRDRAWDFFISRRIILRPLGNIIYILPPYCIRQDELNEVYTAIESFVQEIS